MSFMSAVVEAGLIVKIGFYRALRKTVTGFKKLISRRRHSRQFQSKIDEMKNATPRAPKARTASRKNLKLRFLEGDSFEDTPEEKLLLPEKTEPILIEQAIASNSD